MRKPGEPLIIEDAPLTEAEIQTVLAGLEDGPYAIVPGWYWLSFADDTGFLGVAITYANSFDEALRATRRKGINPGGSVQGVVMDDTIVQAHIPEAMRERLLTKEEVMSMGPRSEVRVGG